MFNGHPAQDMRTSKGYPKKVRRTFYGHPQKIHLSQLCIFIRYPKYIPTCTCLDVLWMSTGSTFVTTSYVHRMSKIYLNLYMFRCIMMSIGGTFVSTFYISIHYPKYCHRTCTDISYYRSSKIYYRLYINSCPSKTRK